MDGLEEFVIIQDGTVLEEVVIVNWLAIGFECCTDEAWSLEG